MLLTIALWDNLNSLLVLADPCFALISALSLWTSIIWLSLYTQSSKAESVEKTSNRVIMIQHPLETTIDSTNIFAISGKMLAFSIDFWLCRRGGIDARSDRTTLLTMVYLADTSNLICSAWGNLNPLAVSSVLNGRSPWDIKYCSFSSCLWKWNTVFVCEEVSGKG